MLKLCRRYLNWIQNSVLEGEITQVKLDELLHQAVDMMDPEEDSIILFTSSERRWMKKKIIGLEKSEIDNFL